MMKTNVLTNHGGLTVGDRIPRLNHTLNQILNLILILGFFAIFSGCSE